MEFELMFMILVQQHYRIMSLRRKNKRRMVILRARLKKLTRPATRPKYAILGIQLDSEISRLLGGCPLMSRKHIRVLPQSVNRIAELLPVKPWGWSSHFSVVVFLFWLACGTSFRVVSVAFNIPRATCHRICTSVLDSVIGLLPTIIRLPDSNEAMLRMGEGFANRSRSNVFLKAAGAIDGTHIRVLCPSLLHDQYICRKLFYSIQLQAVCDHDGKFIDIMTGFPGSVNDKRVLRYSKIYRNGRYPPQGYFLLGDGGYNNILQPITILAPYRDTGHLTPAMVRFNHQHSKGRMIIECVFGSMCQRWRSIFQKSLEVKLKKAVKIITACCILHNVCLSAGDVVAHAPEPRRDCFPPANVARDQLPADNLRNELCALLATEPPIAN